MAIRYNYDCDCLLQFYFTILDVIIIMNYSAKIYIVKLLLISGD